MSQTNGNTEESASGNFLHLSKHPQYYIPTGDLSILVDHVQFKVHRYFFERESKFFANKLATPATPGSSLPGLDDPNAIILERVTPEQFATFLWVFYNEKYSIYEAPIDKWEIILRLSTDWSFPEVKSLSIRELEKKIMPDVKRVKMYHENKVDRNILIPRYAALIEREEPLTFEEGYDLGMETAMMIARGREEARSARQPNGARSPSTPTIHGADLYEAIRALFKITPSEGVVEAEPAHNGHNSTGALVPTEPLPSKQLPTEQPPTPTATQKPAPKSQKQQPQTKKGAKKGTEPAPLVAPKSKPAQPAPSTNSQKHQSDQERKETEAERTNADKESKVDTPVVETSATEPLVPVEGTSDSTTGSASIFSPTTTAPATTTDLADIWADSAKDAAPALTTDITSPTTQPDQKSSVFGDIGISW